VGLVCSSHKKTQQESSTLRPRGALTGAELTTSLAGWARRKSEYRLCCCCVNQQRAHYLDLTVRALLLGCGPRSTGIPGQNAGRCRSSRLARNVHHGSWRARSNNILGARMAAGPAPAAPGAARSDVVFVAKTVGSSGSTRNVAASTAVSFPRCDRRGGWTFRRRHDWFVISGLSITSVVALRPKICLTPEHAQSRNPQPCSPSAKTAVRPEMAGGQTDRMLQFRRYASKTLAFDAPGYGAISGTAQPFTLVHVARVHTPVVDGNI